MTHGSASNHCTVQRRNGSFCDLVGAPDMPFPICIKHALRLFRRMSEVARQTESDLPRLMRLAFDQLDDDRERKAKQPKVHEPLVYYVLVGDLLKIGTSTNIKARLRTYPPNRKLLATEPGGYDVEKRRHALFSDLLAHGNEWFRFEGLLVEWVQRIRKAEQRAA